MIGAERLGGFRWWWRRRRRRWPVDPPEAVPRSVPGAVRVGEPSAAQQKLLGDDSCCPAGPALAGGSSPWQGRLCWAKALGRPAWSITTQSSSKQLNQSNRGHDVEQSESLLRDTSKRIIAFILKNRSIHKVSSERPHSPCVLKTLHIHARVEATVEHA